MLANFSAPFVQPAVFVVEAGTDKVQLVAHDNVPEADIRQPPEWAYLQAWAANMTRALTSFEDPAMPRLGTFHPACLMYV
jgi:hypothetical protein